MNLIRISLPSVLTCCLMLTMQHSIFAKDKNVAKLLPPTTVIYAEVTEPAALWNVLLDHPILDQVMQMDAIKKELDKPGVEGLKKGVAYIEQQIEMDWKKGLSTVTGGGLYFAIDAKTNGVAILVRSKDQKTLEKLRDIFIQIARSEAKKKEKPDPIQSGEYRGITAYQGGKATFATVDDWLMIVNKDKLGESIIDAYLDGADSTLASHPRFTQARKLSKGKPTGWVYMDIETLRNSGVAKKLYQEKSDNPLLELLVGGVIGGLQKTPYVTSSLHVKTEQLQLSMAMPHKVESVKEVREYYFGKQKQGTAPQLLIPKETIFSLSSHRDFSTMWLNSSDLFVDKIDAGFAKANSTLSTLFSGKDFGEDILGSLDTDVQIVISRQKFTEKRPIPAIKLPAFAMVFKLKDPEEMRDDMRRTLQSLLGFLNVVGGQEQGSPQLDIDLEKTKESQIIISKYIPPRDKGKAKKVKIHYNFSPSFAFIGDKMILSSTTPLARELMSLATEKRPQQNQRPKQVTLNTNMMLDVPLMMKVVEENRKHLIAQNMLEDGKDKAEATMEFDNISKIATWFNSSSIQLSTPKEGLKLQWTIDLLKE